MNTTFLALFHNKEDADKAIDQLKDRGVDPEEISIIMREKRESSDTGKTVGGGIAAGATTGGVVGAIAGLLVGIGAIAIPGIGALFIAGPLAASLGLTGAAATTLSGALTGALAGGLVGGLIALGIPEDEARIYEENIKSGAILVAVPTSSLSDTEIRDILQENHADQIRPIDVKSESMVR